MHGSHVAVCFWVLDNSHECIKIIHIGMPFRIALYHNFGLGANILLAIPEANMHFPNNNIHILTFIKTADIGAHHHHGIAHAHHTTI